MPRNPYTEQSLHALAEACMVAATALEPGKKRSPGGQLKFEERLKLLLIATSHRLNPDFFQAMRHDENFPSIRDAGMAWVARRAQEARYLVLVRAAEKVLGGSAERWLRDTRGPDGQQAISEIALRDDEGLRKALDLLASRAPERGI